MADTNPFLLLQNCPFKLQQRVTLIEIQRPARLIAIQIDEFGLQFHVAYWNDGERQTAWVFSDEIHP